jgi:hypothetical protein
MPELLFEVQDVSSMPYAAIPTIIARLRVTNTAESEPVQSVLLNCQLQIQPLGRTYSAVEEARLLDLFGERERWGQTMKPLHWASIVLKVPAFTRETMIDLPLPCSVDFDVAANKYFYGLDEGTLAVNAMFSGTVFYADEQGALQATQIPWDSDARFKIPVAVWKQAVESHYGEAAWMRLSSQVFDRLYRYKVARGIPMWDSVINQLLNHAETREVSQELAVAEGGTR